MINVNRRGAPASRGKAKDVYRGSKGWLDPKAALTFLVGHPRVVPPESTVLIGASKWDGIVIGLHDARRNRQYSAIVQTPRNRFLSPGKYTEAQFSIDSALKTISTILSHSIYPTSERRGMNELQLSTRILYGNGFNLIPEVTERKCSKPIQVLPLPQLILSMISFKPSELGLPIRFAVL